MRKKVTERTNERLAEETTYVIGPEEFAKTGESYNARLTWKKMHKVTVTDKWVLIWETNQVAHIIPRRDVSTHQLNELITILDGNSIRYKIS